MKSQFYYHGVSRLMASLIKAYLNDRRIEIVGGGIGTTRTTRMIGATLKSLLRADLGVLLGHWCSSYSSDVVREAMADIAFTDSQGFHSVIAVKTYREGTQFSRRNLISVRRLVRLYESDTDVFALILIRFSLRGRDVSVSDVQFVPIEFLDWRCLAIRSSGWGQIQLMDSNDIRIVHRSSRKAWMLQLCDAALAFYPRGIGKIHDRIEFIRSVRSAWEAAEDKWAGQIPVVSSRG